MKTTLLLLEPPDFSEPPGYHHVRREQQRTFAKRAPIFKSHHLLPRKTILVGALALLILLFNCDGARAATITVTNGGDSGPGTLRRAILDAASGDTINFSAGVTTVTLEEELLINRSVTISGPGANLLTVHSAPNFNIRIFEIAPAPHVSVTVAISDLTVTGGQTFGNSSSDDGSGILNATSSTLTITRSTVSNNSSGSDSSGGGISNHGTLTIVDSTISDNVSSIGGGGIFNDDSLTITHCTISGNTAAATGVGGSAGGGGIENYGALTIADSTISNNTAAEGPGGGIQLDNGITTITNSTISNNESYVGGGISNYGGTLTVGNCTIAGNKAATPEGQSAVGGGIYVYQGSVTVSNCTISGNRSDVGGAGITGTLTARNTIIAKNNNGASFNSDFSGTLISQGYNLIGNTTGTTITGNTTGNQLNVDPLLGPLQDNGGPTYTQALQPGSPATDKGDSGGISNDQRGLPRPVDSPNISNAPGGDGSDIGAWEDQSFCQTLVTNNNDSGPGSLRAAVANVCAGGSVTFAPSVVSPINLTTSELVISRPMTITGPGANLMTVQRSTSASTNFSIFHISSGALDTVSGLTITKGNPNHSGGGIFIDNSSTLFLDSCAVVGNSANAGAAASNGGGIATGGAGTPSADIVRSTISGNSAANDGGGVNVGNLDIDTSTISGNTAGRYGGGINASGTTRVLNSTIANNSTATGGGVRGNGTSVNLGNTIIAKNTATTTDPDFSGSFTSQEGYNLIGNITGTSFTGTTTGNQLNVDPLLGPLQNNGGRTQTMALLTGSPAIDKGFGGGVAHSDQRGANRPYDDPNIANAADGEDMGAFEVTTLIPTSAVSRKTQGPGTYDINLPLTGAPGIECRSGGANNDYQVVVTFPTFITFSGASVTSGTGSVSSASRSINGTQVTVNLTGVSNAQRIVVTLSGVSNGVDTGNVAIQMAILVGDTNGNGSVNSSDVSQTKLQSGQAVTVSNFREDVTANGTINASDVSSVKLKSGTALPP